MRTNLLKKYLIETYLGCIDSITSDYSEITVNGNGVDVYDAKKIYEHVIEVYNQTADSHDRIDLDIETKAWLSTQDEETQETYHEIFN